MRKSKNGKPTGWYGAAIVEPFHLHGRVIDRGEGCLHMDGLALSNVLLVKNTCMRYL